MMSRDARWVAAAVQLVIAWEWLVSGANKVLSGSFPQGLAGTLRDGMQQNPNGWYVALLDRVVLPHSVFFGYLIEETEVLVGFALLIGAVALIGPMRRRGAPEHRLLALEIGAAAVATLICAFLCVNFHFFMGNGIIPWINPSQAYDEGITLDTLMPPLCILLFIFNARVLVELTEAPFSTYARRFIQPLSALVRRERPAASLTTH